MKTISLLTTFIGLCLILAWGFLLIPAIADLPDMASQPERLGLAGETKSVKIDSMTTTISGYGEVAIAKPITFNKISLFIISQVNKDTKKPQDFITLKEGLARGIVTVSEQKSATVGTLQVTNHSDKPLFIQGGDVVEGGQQDRAISVSLIIQPRTTVDVPSLCVEPSRWTGQSQFRTSKSYSCSNAMRLAILRRNQNAVWEQVRQIKAQAEEITKQKSSTSSFTEEITNGQMRKASGEYEKTFAKLAEQYPDALGLAYILNGEIYAIEFFQSHLLFKQAYPKLIKAYIKEAVLNTAWPVRSVLANSGTGNNAPSDTSNGAGSLRRSPNDSSESIGPAKVATASPEKPKTITEEEIIKFINDLHGSKAAYTECIGGSQIIQVENDNGIYQEVIDIKSKAVIHRQYLNKLTIANEELKVKGKPASVPEPPMPPVQLPKSPGISYPPSDTLKPQNPDLIIKKNNTTPVPLPTTPMPMPGR
ncbi:MAG: DUF6569 family protein [Planctomycetota bacterium]